MQKAKTICELCFLPREELLEMLKAHSYFRDRVRDLVNVHFKGLKKRLERNDMCGKN